jgi:hypothetical protein
VDGATEDGNIETTLRAAVAITVPLYPGENPSIPGSFACSDMNMMMMNPGTVGV